ncbi:MAG TPA: glycoside hydrolase family 32 protein [Clostridiales bacterium]|nr:glycoside hydrolase family 32 protein [Clostridiales bacterium]
MEFILKKRYLCFPVKSGAPLCRTRLLLPGYHVHVDLELTDGQPDFWVYFDAYYDLGKGIQIVSESGSPLHAGDLAVLSDRPVGDELLYREERRPLYHFTTARGWINDPNGLVYKNGEYHMFYQLNSFGCRGFDKGWGHAKSKNLFDWEILPPALYADETGYAISGSALFDTDNRAGFGRDAWILAYSSRFGDAPERGQAQNIAYSTDGRTFHKYGKNPVIEDYACPDFRDPKVFWHEPSGHFVMAVTFGAVLRFYTSGNLKQWTMASELEADDFRSEGKIKECPELMEYQIEGEEGTRWVLTLSYTNDRRVQHIIGDFDGRTFTWDRETEPRYADYGKDYYAAVAWNPFGEMAGRKLYIGWMCYWEYALQCTNREGWMGAFTVPREHYLRRHGDGKLYIHQAPARELASLMQEGREIPRIMIPPEQNYKTGFYEACELSFTLKQENTRSGYTGFQLCYQSGEAIDFNIDFVNSILVVDRSRCGGQHLGEAYQEKLTVPVSNIAKMDIRLLIDKGCFELFIEDGLSCMAAICFPGVYTGNILFYNKCGEEYEVSKLAVRPIRRAQWKY